MNCCLENCFYRTLAQGAGVVTEKSVQVCTGGGGEGEGWSNRSNIADNNSFVQK